VIARRRDDLLSPFLIHRAHEKRRESKQREHWSQVLPEMLSREFHDLRDQLGLFDSLPAEHALRSMKYEL
jgi:hypothetical protein